MNTDYEDKDYRRVINIQQPAIETEEPLCVVRPSQVKSFAKYSLVGCIGCVGGWASMALFYYINYGLQNNLQEEDTPITPDVTFNFGF